jgi:hypothetical protein
MPDIRAQPLAINRQQMADREEIRHAGCCTPHVQAAAGMMMYMTDLQAGTGVAEPAIVSAQAKC